ncbi:hypothetical protein BO221_13960 [Archangium sp. Cb G35]|uniref:hypothetical protein n=1 Tax=Archangium sp. Cb G35 TaxID=1920190 RepID=UPI0009373063|nr:hypothetical protein [Archangium sp. Cb G35]OJT24277.1 hypothetical protein BO221_13960 [Archangium sp. Cb G35]
MSRSMFDDLEVSQSEAVGAADSRTLRFAAHALTEADLQGLLRYQEAFLAHAEQAKPGETTALTTAHELGLKASGLAVKVVEMGNSMLRAYAGQRWTARRLRTRLAELEQQSDAVSVGKAGKVRDELHRVESLEPLARRYGQEAIDLLNQHEEQLVALHTRMQKALTRA